jgi:hypothetical protein
MGRANEPSTNIRDIARNYTHNAWSLLWLVIGLDIALKGNEYE